MPTFPSEIILALSVAFVANAISSSDALKIPVFWSNLNEIDGFDSVPSANNTLSLNVETPVIVTP